MITELQIEKLRGHALLFSENLRSLIQTFEMLQPVAEDQALLLQYSGTKRAHGLLVVRWSMIQECLIGITKLAFDQQPNNPSARNLITGLLAPEAKELREALKADFAVPIRPGPPLGERTPEQLQDWEEHWKEEEKREAKELEAAFEEHLKSLCERWFWFENHRTEFKKIRDKQLANLDTSKVGSDYVLTPVNGPDWKTVKEAIDRLVELAELLLTVLHRLDESFDQFRELAKRDASGFWQAPRSPDREKAQGNHLAQ
jgi:AbiU2